MGRLFYQAGQVALGRANRPSSGSRVARFRTARKMFRLAIKYYDRVSWRSRHWRRALLEQSWAFSMLGNRLRQVLGPDRTSGQLALGNLRIVTAPVPGARHYPEAYILRAVIHFRACRYLAATAAVKAFQREYRPLWQGIRKLVRRSSDSAEFAQLARRIRGGTSRLPGKVASLVRSALGERDLVQHSRFKGRYNALELALSLQARKLQTQCVHPERCRRAFVRAGTVVRRLGYHDQLQRWRNRRQPSFSEVVRVATIPDLRVKPLLDYRSVEIASRLAKVRLLMIQGAHDPITPPATTRALAKALPHAKLVMFASSGHLPFVEERRRFRAEIRRFLGLDPRRPPAPAILGAGWRPPYAGQRQPLQVLQREARILARRTTALRVNLMLAGVCQLFGPRPSASLLARFRLRATEHRAFHAAHCTPR